MAERIPGIGGGVGGGEVEVEVEVDAGVDGEDGEDGEEVVVSFAVLFLFLYLVAPRSQGVNCILMAGIRTNMAMVEPLFF